MGKFSRWRRCAFCVTRQAGFLCLTKRGNNYMAITAGKINLFRGCNYKWIKAYLVCKNCGGIRKIKLQSGHGIFAFSSGYITPPYRWCYSFKIRPQYYLRTVRLVYRVYASHNSSNHMTAPMCLTHWMICITWESDLAEVHVDVLAGFLV